MSGACEECGVHYDEVRDAKRLRAELVKVGAERAALRRRVRLALAELRSEEGAGGGDDGMLRAVALLNLRRPLPPRPKRHGGGR